MGQENFVLKTCFMESFDGEKLYTEVYLPDENGTYPVICIRDPYVQKPTGTEQERKDLFAAQAGRLGKGFAVVHQHCRGYGGSGGVAHPFIYERRDGLVLLDWIQKQPFFDGSIYLEGGSYTAFVHLCCLDELPDCVKAASLAIFSSHAHSFAYLNGEYKMRLGPLWFPMVMHGETPLLNVDNCADKKAVNDFYKKITYQYPFSEYTERMYGHDVPCLTEWFFMNNDDDEMAVRRNGIGDMHDVMKHAKIPILLRGGYFDPFYNGMVPMWYELPEEVREKSAFLVGPWTHSMTLSNVEKCPFIQEEGERVLDHAGDFFLYVRDGKPFPHGGIGKVNAYVMNEGKWEDHDGFYDVETQPRRMYPAEGGVLSFEKPENGEITYRYNPYDPPFFRGGPNAFFTECDGAALQEDMNMRPDVKSFMSEPFKEDMRFRGSTKVHFAVRSDCEDTAFLARISLVTENGEAWVLQETITPLSRAAGTYQPNSTAEFDLDIEPMFWTAKAGERIRVDIASANAFSYWPHSNTWGQWAVQKHPKVAMNTIVLGKTYVEFPEMVK